MMDTSDLSMVQVLLSELPVAAVSVVWGMEVATECFFKAGAGAALNPLAAAGAEAATDGAAPASHAIQPGRVPVTLYQTCIP
jgi:hypothetical protein